MKHILVSILVGLFGVLPAVSQPIGQRHKLELLDPFVERAVVTQTVKPIQWQQQLVQIQTAFHYVRLSYRENELPMAFDPGLNYQEERVYLQRLLRIQKWVNENPVLKGYTFAAPIPTDLARLRTEKLEALQSFLQNAQTATVVKTDRIRPFTLALSLGHNSSALEVWIDVPSKKVYLMSDNFYTTSVGKYGIHLK